MVMYLWRLENELEESDFSLKHVVSGNQALVIRLTSKALLLAESPSGPWDEVVYCRLVCVSIIFGSLCLQEPSPFVLSLSAYVCS